MNQTVKSLSIANTINTFFRLIPTMYIHILDKSNGNTHQRVMCPNYGGWRFGQVFDNAR